MWGVKTLARHCMDKFLFFCCGLLSDYMLVQVEVSCIFLDCFSEAICCLFHFLVLKRFCIFATPFGTWLTGRLRPVVAISEFLKLSYHLVWSVEFNLQLKNCKTINTPLCKAKVKNILVAVANSFNKQLRMILKII